MVEEKKVEIRGKLRGRRHLGICFQSWGRSLTLVQSRVRKEDFVRNRKKSQILGDELLSEPNHPALKAVEQYRVK